MDRDNSDLVQLGRSEVSAACLEGPGVELDELLAGFQPLEDDPRFSGLTEFGWRVILPHADHDAKPRVELAAPLLDAAGHWVVLGLTKEDAAWRVSMRYEPAAVRPPKAIRRQGLELRWLEDPILAPAGTPLTLRIGLHNGSERPWPFDPADMLDGYPLGFQVLGWLHHPGGERLPASPRHSWASGVRQDRQVAPGETAELTVRLLTDGVERLPPGEYDVSAVLSSLDLHAPPGRLRLR